MNTFEKLREKKRTVIEDIRASVRYTPNRETDLLAFMCLYIKSDTEQREKILTHVRQCMDGESYPNPYQDEFGYTDADVDSVNRLLEEYLDRLQTGAENPRGEAETVLKRIRQINEACSGSMLDDWRHERLCGVISGAAELAEAALSYEPELS